MPGDLERLSAPASAAALGAGPAGLAGEVLSRTRAELPVVGELGEREQVLVLAWLTGLRSARTRRACAGDVVAWLGWLDKRGAGVLAAGRVHVDPVGRHPARRGNGGLQRAPPPVRAVVVLPVLRGP